MGGYSSMKYRAPVLGGTCCRFAAALVDFY